jgi:hypothetical protein
MVTFDEVFRAIAFVLVVAPIFAFIAWFIYCDFITKCLIVKYNAIENGWINQTQGLGINTVNYNAPNFPEALLEEINSRPWSGPNIYKK